jgi:hypothetical protein
VFRLQEKYVGQTGLNAIRKQKSTSITLKKNNQIRIFTKHTINRPLLRENERYYLHDRDKQKKVFSVCIEITLYLKHKTKQNTAQLHLHGHWQSSMLCTF